MSPRLAALSVLLAALLAPACSVGLPPPTYGQEDPLGSGRWTTVLALPDWVARPTAEGEQHRFVTRDRSNMLPIAAPEGLPTLGEAFTRQLVQTLTPELGEQLASWCARAVAAQATPLARASKEELLTRESVVGNTMATAWTLWEVNLDAVLAGVAADERDETRRILLSTPLGGPVDED